MREPFENCIKTKTLNIFFFGRLSYFVHFIFFLFFLFFFHGFFLGGPLLVNFLPTRKNFPRIFSGWTTFGKFFCQQTKLKKKI